MLELFLTQMVLFQPKQEALLWPAFASELDHAEHTCMKSPAHNPQWNIQSLEILKWVQEVFYISLSAWKSITVNLLPAE